MRKFFIFICLITVQLHAQSIDDPWSSQFPLPELKAIINFDEPTESIEQLLEKERIEQGALKTFVFGIGIETSLTPQTAGQWDTISDKGYVWRIGIQAKYALSLNLLVENYMMLPGMALFAYDRAKNNIAGPFDARYNSNGGILPVSSLPGDMIIVEWNIPIQTTSLNHFTITSIGYGFRNISEQSMIRALSSGDCNVDVNCLSGNHWQREKRSVVLMETILSDRRTQYCTGVLVNQAVAPQDKKPYILTANHCISTAEQAQSTTFFFGYEKEYCHEVANTVKSSGITGSTLLSTYRNLDFSLLALPENSLSTHTHRPFYAGWSASGLAPHSVAGIHHPQGDIKKISISSTELLSRTFEDAQENLKCDENAHWLVRRWDSGVTEGGSSGSPIFDADHKIVGTLSGGFATCSNKENDYYSKFSEQWNKYPEKETSLKQWLDPQNKGIASLWGYDTMTGYEGQYEMTGNIGKNENETLLKAGDWGYLTSLNSKNWTGFAEKIKNDSIADIIGLEVHVAKVSEPGVYVRFSVWSGKDFPVTLLESKSMKVTPEYENYPMHVYFDNPIDEIDGDFFIGYILENTANLDTFAVYHSPLRPYPGISGMFVQENNGIWKALENETPPLHTSLDIKAIGRFTKQNQIYILSQKRELNIIVQKNNDIVSLLFDIDESFASLQSVTIECYDTSGKRLLCFNDVNGFMNIYGEKAYLQVEMDIGILLPGVYIINVFDKNRRQTGRFIKLP